MKKAKVFTIILIILCTILLPACENIPNESLATTPIQSQREPYDLGKVYLLYGAPIEEVINGKKDRQIPILDMVCEAILKEKNARMNLVPLCEREPMKKLVELVASGLYPEICVALPLNSIGAENTAFAPMQLNAAIERYGANLSKIPEEAWNSVSVNDRILAIPTSHPYDTSVVVANRTVMEKKGWKLPDTFDDFEHLLQQAAEARLTPIACLEGWLYATQPWFGITQDIYRIERKELVSYYVQPGFVAMLEAQRQWVDAGFMKQIFAEKNTENWLFAQMSTIEMASRPDVLPVPILQAGQLPPVTPMPSFFGPGLQSYSRPDALVLFADWMASSESNSRLISMGVEGEDYTMQNATTFRWKNGQSWPGYRFFSMQNLFGLCRPDAPNNAAVDAAVDDASQYALPDESSDALYILYAAIKPQSKLSLALQKNREYGDIMANASIDVIWNRISLSDYLETATENQPMLMDYVDLMEEYRLETYKPIDNIIFAEETSPD